MGVGEVGVARDRGFVRATALPAARCWSSSSTPRLNNSTGSSPHGLTAVAIDALGTGEVAAVVQEAPEVDARIDEGRIGRDRLPVGAIAASASAASSAAASSNHDCASRVRRCARSHSARRSAGSASNSSTYWPDSACQRAPPSRTTTRSATAPIARPDSGIASGRRCLSSRIDRVIRRAGTLASTSACAVRRTIRSWNENRQAPRAPRVGVTNPASTSERMVLRGRRSRRWTSCTP